MKAHQCMECGKFAKYEDLDQYIPFGCSNPGSPEPYDPTILCGECSKLLYNKYKERFRNGYRGGDWQKSNAEIKAAKECGLIWVHSSGTIINGKAVAYCYITKTKQR